MKKGEMEGRKVRRKEGWKEGREEKIQIQFSLFNIA